MNDIGDLEGGQSRFERLRKKTETTPEEPLTTEWNKTVLAQDRLREKGLFEEPDRASKKGYYSGRPIIGRDTRINGGVYIGGGEREAIVVDDTTGEEGLNEIYQELIKIRQTAVKKGEYFKENILSDVFELVERTLPYSEKAVRRVTSDYDLGPDEKISINAYLQEKGGVCRHQALLAAYLLERLGEEGKVKGRVSIDRNYISGKGGHAWVRYTNSANEVFIIDPARGFISELEGIDTEWRHFYERPKKLLGRLTKKS